MDYKLCKLICGESYACDRLLFVIEYPDFHPSFIRRKKCM